MRYLPKNEEKYLRAREMYWEGELTQQTIASELGVCRSTITSWTKDLRLKRRLILTLKIRLVRLMTWKGGLKQTTIAYRLGVGVRLVQEWTWDIRLMRKLILVLKRHLARMMYKQGSLSGAISDELGVSRNTVVSWTKDLPSVRKEVKFRKEWTCLLSQKEGLNPDQLAKELGVHKSTIYTYLENLFTAGRQVEHETWEYEDPEGERWVSASWLARAAGLHRDTVYEVLKKKGVSYITLRVGKPFRKIKFFNLEEVFRYCPSWQKRISYREEIKILPDNHVLKDMPDDVSFRQWIVLCGLVTWKIDCDYWPSSGELAWALKNEGYVWNPNQVKQTLHKLVGKGFITVEVQGQTSGGPSALRRRYVIHRAPWELVARMVGCPHCGKDHSIFREFYQPKNR